MSIQGKTALITGASRGLGAALARELAGQGMRVVLVARERAPLLQVAEDIQRAGGEAHAIAADVGDKQAVYAIAGSAAALAGPVDVVIHNASTLGPTPLPLLIDTECEDLERVFAVNVVGPFRLTKALAGAMLLRGGGLFIHITSDAAVSPYPRWGAYGASKAAFDHLSRIWAQELAGTGVRFLIVDPGEMDTQMHADAIPDADRSQLGRPEEVARGIAALIGRADAGDIDSGSTVSAAEGGTS